MPVSQKKEIKYNNNNNMWITKVIRISSTRKRELLLLCRYNRDPNLKTYYKQYCRMLTRIISAAKRAHYNRMILKSNNKVKSTWRIINEVKGNIKRNKGIHSIVIGKKVVTNQEKIATAFNKYFLSIADSIIPENNNHTNKEIVNPINYLVNTFSRPFNKINWKYATFYEIEKIIRYLKTKNTSGYNEISNNNKIKFSIYDFSSYSYL
jgi:hypothetical protein